MAQLHHVIDDELYKRVKIQAVKEGRLIKRWVEIAIREKIERDCGRKAAAK